jgi:hypothetical protein
MSAFISSALDTLFFFFLFIMAVSITLGFTSLAYWGVRGAVITLTLLMVRELYRSSKQNT